MYVESKFRLDVESSLRVYTYNKSAKQQYHLISFKSRDSLLKTIIILARIILRIYFFKLISLI